MSSSGPQETSSSITKRPSRPRRARRPSHSPSPAPPGVAQNPVTCPYVTRRGGRRPSSSPLPSPSHAPPGVAQNPVTLPSPVTCPYVTRRRPQVGGGRRPSPSHDPVSPGVAQNPVTCHPHIPPRALEIKGTGARGSNRCSEAPGTPVRPRRLNSPRLSSTPRTKHTHIQEPAPTPLQPRKRRRKEERGAESPHKKGVVDVEPPQKPSFTSIRTRFKLHEPDPQEAEENLSSDLSIELSVQEENLSLSHSLSLEEEEEEEEEEELPSFLKQSSNKPSIREGLCVWCKLRKYPFWPAMVKSVNHKNKKASIVFIDQFLFDKKRICKGLSVSLRTLKPFDCEENKHFVDTAKERYGKSITWCLELISDYRIRIGCGSFEGSIIEYIADDISYPLRSEYYKASSDLLSPTQSLMEQQGGDSELHEDEQHVDGSHQVHEVKKVLPDRAQAARNRANQRLVDFIIKKRGAEGRLLGVVSTPETSRWWQVKQSSSPRLVVGVYLEDEEQVEQVYRYLEGLCKGAALFKSHPHTDRISFILDVLLPEALTHAIAAVDRLTLQEAEGKFQRGPRHSIREQQEFDRMIEQQMKRKATAASL